MARTFSLCVLWILFLAWVVAPACSGPVHPPYPPSPVLAEVTFDWSTHDRRAPGSDNWPITWADDDHQYTSWGDGGGFGGTNNDGRVSLGVARVEGAIGGYRGFNVWGGKDPEHKATFDGKSYGILSVDGGLYMWVSPGSDATNYEEAKIYNSTNHGASWTAATWSFVKSDGIILPTFLQFGKDYRGAKDDFVYVYGNQFKSRMFSVKEKLRVQRPGEIALMRTPKTEIMNRTAYEFFAGLDRNGTPIWTKDPTIRRPVFEDPNGVGWNTSVSFNRGLGRYFLMTEHAASAKGKLGIFDAPEPWGPWTTALYTDSFGAPSVQPSTFFWNFSNKWLSEDGKRFVVIFTGTGTNDSWNTVRGVFETTVHSVSGSSIADGLENPQSAIEKQK